MSRKPIPLMLWIFNRNKRRIADLERICQEQSDRADKLQDLANQLSETGMAAAEALVRLEERHANLREWADQANALLIQAIDAIDDQQEYVEKYNALITLKAPLSEN